MPRSKFTGTQKKAQKKIAKIQGKMAELAYQQAKQTAPYKKSAANALKQIQKGRHLPETSITNLLKTYEKAGRGAEKLFEKQKEERLAEFDQYVQPDVVNRFGRESGAGSSALNQALAAAKTNLSRQLSSDYEQLRNNLAMNLMGQQYQGKVAGLNARLQSSGALFGQSISPQFAGALESPYMQKTGQSSGVGGQLLGGGLAALGSFAGSEAGAAALAGLFSSREVKENIKDYEKGLEEVRKFEVKQYDYTVPVPGKQNDRVGLIAEDVPEEIRTKIDNINAIDLYGLVGILINAVKELDKKVKSLEGEKDVKSD